MVRRATAFVLKVTHAVSRRVMAQYRWRKKRRSLTERDPFLYK